MKPPGAAPKLLLLAGLFLLALAPRVLYQVQMSAGPLWNTPILDEAVNHDWALEVAAGRGPGELPFFRAPLYPWFVGLVYAVLGPQPAAVLLLQAVLSSLTCVLVWWVARRAFGPPAGWWAGALAAGYWPWIYFDGELQDVPLTLLLNLAALALLVAWKPAAGTPWRLAAAGFLLGLSAITRPTVLVAVAAVGAWILVPRAHGNLAARLRALLALGAGLAAAILPVTSLNLVGGGDAVLVASQGGMNFYIGNHPGSDGHSARFPGVRADWKSLVEESRLQAEAALGRPLRPSEVSRYWFRQGLRFWRRQPAAAMRLTARKAGYLLGSPELPNNKQIRFLIERYAPLLMLPWPGFGLVAPLALVGLLWGGGGRRRALLAAFVLSYGATVLAFFVNARFRMPMAAVGIVLAGGGAAFLVRQARAGAWRRLTAPAMFLVLAAVLVWLPARGHRENLAHGHYTLARAHRQGGDLRRAEDEYRLALERDPSLSEAVLGLSSLLLEGGRAPEAVGLLEAAVAADPGDRRSQVNLALALEAAGRPAAAVEVLEKAVAAWPRDANLWLGLGNAQAAAGRSAEAMASFREVLALEPSRVDARFNLANALVSAGRVEEGVRAYRELLDQEPGHAGAWNMLGIALAVLGDQREAAGAFSRGVEVAPDDARLHLNLGRMLIQVGERQAGRQALLQALEVGGTDSEVGRAARQALEELPSAPP